ncbi:MAG: hypothetical protein MZV63_16375 [Marinilabiliales bacterium]|nr:hypothetical protein [Marinilabiliales bacterium]
MLTLNQKLRSESYVQNYQGYMKICNLMPRYLSSTGLDNIILQLLQRQKLIIGINTLDMKYFPDRGTILDISVSTSKLISASIENRHVKRRPFTAAIRGCFVSKGFILSMAGSDNIFPVR